MIFTNTTGSTVYTYFPYGSLQCLESRVLEKIKIKNNSLLFLNVRIIFLPCIQSFEKYYLPVRYVTVLLLFWNLKNIQNPEVTGDSLMDVPYRYNCTIQTRELQENHNIFCLMNLATYVGMEIRITKNIILGYRTVVRFHFFMDAQKMKYTRVLNKIKKSIIQVNAILY